MGRVESYAAASQGSLYPSMREKLEGGKGEGEGVVQKTESVRGIGTQLRGEGREEQRIELPLSGRSQAIEEEMEKRFVLGEISRSKHWGFIWRLKEEGMAKTEIRQRCHQICPLLETKLHSFVVKIIIFFVTK